MDIKTIDTRTVRVRWDEGEFDLKTRRIPPSTQLRVQTAISDASRDVVEAFEIAVELCDEYVRDVQGITVDGQPFEWVAGDEANTREFLDLFRLDQVFRLVSEVLYGGLDDLEGKSSAPTSGAP